MPNAWVAGVDGCKAGWLAVFRPADEPTHAEAEVFSTFAEILRDPRNPRIIAVDMPIGLPERTAHGGRGPEAALRCELGKRRSSVFSVPSREAVYAYQQGYPAACLVARATSGGRAISKQAFHLFPKIQEIDALLHSSSAIRARVFECHPEGSFRMMADEPLANPKKTKRGLDSRRQLLVMEGYAASLLEAAPHGAGPDDLLDACAAAWTAARIATKTALSWPRQPKKDGFGLSMAIWT